MRELVPHVDYRRHVLVRVSHENRECIRMRREQLAKAPSQGKLIRELQTRVDRSVRARCSMARLLSVARARPFGIVHRSYGDRERTCDDKPPPRA